MSLVIASVRYYLFLPNVRAAGCWGSRLGACIVQFVGSIPLLGRIDEANQEPGRGSTAAGDDSD